MLALRAMINIEGQLSIPLAVGAYIRDRALLVISLIWFGYIARPFRWGGSYDFYLQYLHGA
jgi:hypothetical protein